MAGTLSVFAGGTTQTIVIASPFVTACASQSIKEVEAHCSKLQEIDSVLGLDAPEGARIIVRAAVEFSKSLSIAAGQCCKSLASAKTMLTTTQKPLSSEHGNLVTPFEFHSSAFNCLATFLLAWRMRCDVGRLTPQQIEDVQLVHAAMEAARCNVNG